MCERIAAFCLLACSVLAAPAFGEGIEPILLKPPLPAGLTFPKAVHYLQVAEPPEVKQNPGDHIVCIKLDVGVDGHVSNATILKSSGFAAIDSTALELVQGTTYEPATLNGVPVAVRMISQRDLREASIGNSRRIGPVCSWDMLNGELPNKTVPQSASNPDQPN